ncbi:hypothetical protein CsatB_027098 [Cannabis sativa]|jgi:hypothetical protein|uniref:Uncharacterized protein n=1 Tax=Cannabis sativa TaxID=3483 RepID=A0A803QMA0_CANSA|nr:uncharacterized protein LOC115699273 [Cannabis sativa]
MASTTKLLTTFLPKVHSEGCSFQPVLLRRQRQRNGTIACGSRDANGRDYGGSRIVDENMIMLRLRIQEIKQLEIDEANHKECENGSWLRSEWMEWEKQYFEYYIDDVYEGIGLLQNYLMNIRPALALGFLLLVMLSVPNSSGFLFFHMVEIAKQLLS